MITIQIASIIIYTVMVSASIKWYGIPYLMERKRKNNMQGRVILSEVEKENVQLKEEIEILKEEVERLFESQRSLSTIHALRTSQNDYAKALWEAEYKARRAQNNQQDVVNALYGRPR